MHRKPQFSEAVKRAEATFIQRNLAIIARASSTSWQAAAWALERRYPNDFGRQTVEVSGPQGAPVALDVRHYPFLESERARDAAAALVEAMVPSRNGKHAEEDDPD